MSASTISKIENGLIHRGLVHAVSLAASLEANLGVLISRSTARTKLGAVVRAGRRRRLDLPGMGLTLSDLHGGFSSDILEARAVKQAIRGHTVEEHMTHSGEETCHVLSGAFRSHTAGQEHDLFQGARGHPFSNEPHRLENAALGPICLVWVFSDGPRLRRPPRRSRSGRL